MVLSFLGALCGRNLKFHYWIEAQAKHTAGTCSVKTTGLNIIVLVIFLHAGTLRFKNNAIYTVYIWRTLFWYIYTFSFKQKESFLSQYLLVFRLSFIQESGLNFPIGIHKNKLEMLVNSCLASPEVTALWLFLS